MQGLTLTTMEKAMPRLLKTEDMSPSYTQVNFNLGMEIDENSRVQLSVSNLTDERSEAFRFSAES